MTSTSIFLSQQEGDKFTCLRWKRHCEFFVPAHLLLVVCINVFFLSGIGSFTHEAAGTIDNYTLLTVVSLRSILF